MLVCGPDAGLVHERAEKIINASVDDPNDPFALVRIEGDALAAEPSRLVEEAHTVPLFGGRRAVWVKAGSRNFAAAVEAVVGKPADRLPHRHRGRRSAPHRAGARHLREGEDAPPCCPATPTPSATSSGWSTTRCATPGSPSRPMRAPRWSR